MLICSLYACCDSDKKIRNLVVNVDVGPFFVFYPVLEVTRILAFVCFSSLSFLCISAFFTMGEGEGADDRTKFERQVFNKQDYCIAELHLI